MSAGELLMNADDAVALAWHVIELSLMEVLSDWARQVGADEATVLRMRDQLVNELGKTWQARRETAKAMLAAGARSLQ